MSNSQVNHGLYCTTHKNFITQASASRLSFCYSTHEAQISDIDNYSIILKIGRFDMNKNKKISNSREKTTRKSYVSLSSLT